ncbi:hypothetical protein [Conexibacter sp. CPCC 206217]|uniref:hypothetical protein n=1 Tax=Conexibacter sp. CPCC 206217 TaxID=3064574 RepID=UPI00271E062A|nr:hypothetical protein [Conexibacter sp. CPCC 206217]MDO8209401.1 hypothetical protein [Conexibacter sp. CPCC 206217]
MLHQESWGFRRYVPLIAAAISLIVGVALASNVPIVGAERAHAITQYFGGISVGAGGRFVGPYKYLFGVGYEAPWTETVGDNVCVGAKTNADGSGGNAIPFTCVYVAPNTARWTPGGLSNYGYPTYINQEARGIYGAGLMNWGSP